MTTGTALILIFLVTLLIALRWLTGTWRQALITMTFAPAFLAVVAPVAYFTFLLLFSGMHSILNSAGINLSSASVELVSGIFTSMLLLGLTVIYGISALRPAKPRCRIAVVGSPML